MSTMEFAKVVMAVIVDHEVGAALISLWARRDRLTAAELNALRAALDEPPMTAEQIIDNAQRRWAAMRPTPPGRHLRAVGTEDGDRQPGRAALPAHQRDPRGTLSAALAELDQLGWALAAVVDSAQHRDALQLVFDGLADRVIALRPRGSAVRALRRAPRPLAGRTRRPGLSGCPPARATTGHSVSTGRR